MLAHYKTRYFTVEVLFMVTILCIKFNYYEFNTSVNKGFHTHANTTNLLRFRDFEPRNFMSTDVDIMGMPTGQTALMSLNRRRSRGFQFHADDKDMSIELEFIVPFVRIPIERSMDMSRRAFRNLFNLNLHSILTTGAVVAVGGIFAIILKFIFAPFAGVAGYKKTSRNSEEHSAYAWNPFDVDANATNFSKPPTANNVISYVASKLQQNNIDLSKCIQKNICEYIQKRTSKANSGTSGSVMKIVDGVLSLYSVRRALSGTAVQHAIDTAKNDGDCSATYRICNWKPSAQEMFRTLTNTLKYLKII